MKHYRRTIPFFGVMLCALAASGCTTVPPDLGRTDVNRVVGDHGRTVAASADLSSLLGNAITADTAVRIAFVNNPQMKSHYAQLGVAAADLYAAGRITNPVFSGAWLDPDNAAEGTEISLGLVASLTDFLTMPARKRMAQAEFAAMRESVAASILNMAADTEYAYYAYVGAQQLAALRAQIARAASLSAALAERYYEAGNITRRELALEQAQASEMHLKSLHAKAEAMTARTQLADKLGLSVGDEWAVVPSLLLPAEPADRVDALRAQARKRRLELSVAMMKADVAADRRGITDWTRWLGHFEVGVERERESDGEKLSGPVVDWQLPIFSSNRDQVLLQDAELAAAIAEVQTLALSIDNDVQLAVAAMKNAYARVNEYQQRLIPSRIAATEVAQQEEAYMLIGVFEVLTSKQHEYDAYEGYLEAIRDYWLAHTELVRAVGDTLPPASANEDNSIDINELLQQSGGKGGADLHHHHGGAL